MHSANNNVKITETVFPCCVL